MTAISMILAGCSKGGATRSNSPTPTISASDITNSAPYWCDFIPQKSFAIITGIDSGVYEHKDGWKNDQGLCLVYDEPPHAPLGIDWGSINGRQKVDLVTQKYESGNKVRDARPIRLPAPLGYGVILTEATWSDRPFYTISTFRCGDSIPWLSIDLSQVSPGRDPIKDMTELMRIAERRFGDLHRCTPG